MCRGAGLLYGLYKPYPVYFFLNLVLLDMYIKSVSVFFMRNACKEVYAEPMILV